MKDAILAMLPPAHPWREHLLYFDCTDSTNTRAKALADAGAPHGTVLIADRQTGGRGRMGRQFHSPGGVGLYLSAILRPDCAPQDLMHLTCAVAVAACDAVEAAAGLRPGIKWTNDLVLGDRKLAGILTELSIDPETKRVRWAVIGIGVNCCQTVFPPELQEIATSLAMLTGSPVSRERLAAAMIATFSDMDRALLPGRADIMKTYRAQCITLGQDVVLLPSGQTGRALDVDDSGALLVEKPDGSLLTVASGEVSVRKMQKNSRIR